MTIGFFDSSYTVDENVGTTAVGFGVLSGTLGRQITVAFDFASGTATGKVYTQSLLYIQQMQMLTAFHFYL